ncbi:MAG: redoxin domain-containing protein [Chitinophagales bacterium]|nr:redoxin domain-containing protein [Chitinophagales bacterium]
MNASIKIDKDKSVKVLLYIAALYHIFWGLSVICFPHFWFYWTSIDMINYTCIWQFIGIVEIVFGLGFFISSFNIYKHWIIVFLSALIKTVALIGFFLFYFNNEKMSIFNFMLIHFIIWLIPLYYILYRIYNFNYLLDEHLIQIHQADRASTMQMYYTNKGDSLADLNEQQPVLLIFLRHLGCSFCKETLTVVAKKSEIFKEKNINVVLVNMSDGAICEQVFQQHELDDITYIIDKESMLYKTFQLRRGKFLQLFGWKVWKRAIGLKFKKNINAGFVDDSDIYQMPGIFLVYKNEILHEYQYKSAADKAPIEDFLKSV